MLCSGFVGLLRCGWMDGDRSAALGEGERSGRGGAGREQRSLRSRMQNAECKMQIAQREAFLPSAFFLLHSPSRCKMPHLTFSDIAAMTGGTVVQGGDIETASVVIDSREVKP